MKSLTLSSLLRIFGSLFIFLLFIILPGSGQKPTSAVTAFINARIYPSPDDAVIDNGTLITGDGKIIAVGKKDNVKIPAAATIIDCRGMTILAGFWNSHVHFMDPRISSADSLDDARLTRCMQDFFTRYGVAHVFDIGSFTENTLAIRKRIESGKVSGPSVLTTGFPFVAKGGSPFYVEPLKLPELTSVDEAITMIKAQLDAGVDAIKIFAASPVMPGPRVVVMPVDIAKAVVLTAHSRNKLVFAHPTSNDGINVAILAGVDILAHTTPDGRDLWDSSFIRKMLNAHLSLIPTLKLWKWELMRKNLSQTILDEFLNLAIAQTRDYFQAGGNILFGTDIGYMNDYDPTDEYQYLQKAGLKFRDILASLTINPAKRFGFAGQTGMIRAGMDADFVILTADPAIDIRSLTAVKFTYRKGKIIYKEE